MSDELRLALLAPVFSLACYSPTANGPGGDDAGGSTSGDGSTGMTSAPSSTVDPSTPTGEDPSDTADASTNASADDSSTTAAAVCGNGEVEGDEVCDDGENDGSYGGCTADCSALGPHCGDGVTNGEEPCDDGDEVNGNGCNLDCVVSGTVLWTVEYDGAAHGADLGLAVDTNSDDGVVVAGRETSGGNNRGWVRMFDSDGNTSWTEVYSSAAGNVAHNGVVVDANDDVVVAGVAAAEGQGNNAFVRKYGSDGTTFWTEMFDVSDAMDQSAAGLAADMAGHLAEVGTDNADIFVRRLDENGNEMWRRIVSGVDSDAGTSVAIDSDGNVIVTGRLSEPEGPRVWLRKYNPDGNIVWTRIPSEAGDGVPAGRGVAVDGEDNVLLIATTGGGSPSAYLRKFDASGAEQWTADFVTDDIHLTLPSSVTTDSSDNVLVTGIGGDVANEIALIKFGSDGSTMWSQLLTSDSSFSTGNDVAVDGGDNILVTGAALEAGGENTDVYLAKLAP